LRPGFGAPRPGLYSFCGAQHDDRGKRCFDSNFRRRSSPVARVHLQPNRNVWGNSAALQHPARENCGTLIIHAPAHTSDDSDRNFPAGKRSVYQGAASTGKHDCKVGRRASIEASCAVNRGHKSNCSTEDVQSEGLGHISFRNSGPCRASASPRNLRVVRRPDTRRL